MEIQLKGAYILLDVGTDDQERAYKLVCVCGHSLAHHASPIFWYYPDPHHHIIHTRQCTHFKKESPNEFCCEQFQIEED